ncbi:MAG: hypothetical protein HOG89_01175 [Candidatus Peribacter sp.]|nr:hypothetical protein [Candidatus Peribacter sp.]MBT4393260.1 hypothetical protein [Candidatus Peribacter sp.]MBT4601155.1 hypothetical protein [Candidatus Peribacter sp.]MBT5148885.1 hypothetical protein [Candidatus Peribacter sp.]MBT5637235.1 hypothetical protein [Candidatus Peribacter sp.]
MNTQRHSFGDIARRTAFSFFLFSLVLTALLALSWYLLVPELTRVEIGGTVRGLQELKAYKTDLEGQILTMEDQRGSFLLPVNHDLYERLKGLKDERLVFQKLRKEIRQVIVDLIPGRTDIVVISGFYFDATTNIGEIRGEVTNVGPRSMTVLAQFVEDIGAIDMVTNVETSRYTRQEGENGSFYSPFTLRISVR